MRKLRLREWHWLTAGTQVQTRQTHEKMKSLWGGQINENEQVNSCEYCELILKDEKCLSPTGMGKQYQCKTLTCRKAFNLGNYAYISVRRSGAAEAEGMGFEVTSQLCPRRRNSPSSSSEHPGWQSQVPEGSRKSGWCDASVCWSLPIRHLSHWKNSSALPLTSKWCTSASDWQSLNCVQNPCGRESGGWSLRLQISEYRRGQKKGIGVRVVWTMVTNRLHTFSIFKSKKFITQLIVQGRGQGNGNPAPCSHSGTQVVDGFAIFNMGLPRLSWVVILSVR